jgi:CheY-like chemotaxis protein
MNAAATVSVLIVDDDDDIREVLVEVLEAARFTVATARHGREALELLQTVRPEMILLDLNMPIMSGAQFREVQRRDPLLAVIPTVVMTAPDRSIEAAANLSADASLPKPIKLGALLSLVNRFARSPASG